MDRPVLNILARELAESERLVAFADEVGRADARVSEPALPLLLGALHMRLERGLVCLLPDDAEARDAAEAASWFLGEEDVAFMPSRGVALGSGLEPPPHLVGERFRSLDVLATGGLVCVSALALAEQLPPPEARPEAIALRVGDEPGVDGLAERLALAGYDRVERAEERGQFAVRGGIVDVYPTTGREPIRVELFGDEVEAIRVFSPFTQRALRAVEEALFYPAAERRLDLVEPTLRDEEDEPRAQPDDLVPPLTAHPDLVWRPEAVQETWREGLGEELEPGPASRLDPLPQGQPFAFEAQRPAIAARGLAEAENELQSFVRGGLRVVVAF